MTEPCPNPLAALGMRLLQGKNLGARFTVGKVLKASQFGAHGLFGFVVKPWPARRVEQQPVRLGAPKEIHNAGVSRWRLLESFPSFSPRPFAQAKAFAGGYFTVTFWVESELCLALVAECDPAFGTHSLSRH